MTEKLADSWESIQLLIGQSWHLVVRHFLIFTIVHPSAFISLVSLQICSLLRESINATSAFLHPSYNLL